MPYEIRKQKNGNFALFNPNLRETMHPRMGPWQEATQIYVGGTGLEELLLAPAKSRRNQRVTVFDVGLGGAANALAAVECHQQLQRKAAQGGKAPHQLQLVSFENDLSSLQAAIENANQLQYPRGHEEALTALLEEGHWEGDNLVWDLRMGEFPRLIDEEVHKADIIFWDPFSPRSNPDMWRLDVVEAVHRCRRMGADTRLITYSSSNATRATFLLAGFFVGDGPRTDTGHTTIASTRFSDIKAPLDRRWLSRWRNERHPWPPGLPTSQHRAVREALLAHEQWTYFETPEDAPVVPKPKSTPRPKKGGPLPKPRGWQIAQGEKSTIKPGKPTKAPHKAAKAASSAAGKSSAQPLGQPPGKSSGKPLGKPSGKSLGKATGPSKRTPSGQGSGQATGKNASKKGSPHKIKNTTKAQPSKARSTPSRPHIAKPGLKRKSK